MKTTVRLSPLFYHSSGYGLVLSITYSSLRQLIKLLTFFGGLFIIQGILFVIYGIIKNSITFENQNNIYNYIAIIFISYALIIYPILGYSFGHKYPYSPTFGLP